MVGLIFMLKAFTYGNGHDKGFSNIITGLKKKRTLRVSSFEL